MGKRRKPSGPEMPSRKVREKMIRDVKPEDPFWFERAQGETLVQVLVWTANQIPEGPARSAFVKGALLGAASSLGVEADTIRAYRQAAVEPAAGKGRRA